MKKMGFVALAAAMPLAPATANTCWKTAAIEAAQVRDMDMMLMVSALRCRGTAHNFLPAYNRFVQEKRVALTGLNDELRAHFRAQVGPIAGLGAYDDYVTGLANIYGAGVGGLACRDLQSIADAANALPPTRSALLELAAAAGLSARINGARCDVVVAVASEAKPANVAPVASAVPEVVAMASTSPTAEPAPAAIAAPTVTIAAATVRGPAQ
jgi:hypothetical protein